MTVDMRRGPVKQPTLPLEPLLEGRSRKMFAQMVGVNRLVVTRWDREGIPLYRADDLAVNVAGTHPIEVWGPAWLEACDEMERRRQERERWKIDTGRR